MPTLNLEIPALHESIVFHPAPFKVIAAGRRFGKTQLFALAIAKHLNDKFYQHGREMPKKIWYIAPTYTQAKTVFWGRIKQALRPLIVKSNEVELSLTLIGGTELTLIGGDRPDSLRGVYLTLALFDEAAYIREEVWTEVVRPMLLDCKGEAIFASTPNGFNWFHQLYEKGLGRKQYTAWASWRHASWEGGYITKEDVIDARADMSEERWQQEFEADFLGTYGRVVRTFGEHNKVNTEYDKTLGLILTCDFNVDPICWSVAQAFNNEIHFVDEICIPNSGTQEAIEVFFDRYSSHPKHFILTGDASGFARRSSTEKPNQSDYTLIENAFEKYKLKSRLSLSIPAANPPIKARINALVDSCQTADGTVRLFINPDACKWGTWNLENVRYITGSDELWKPSHREMQLNERMKFYGHPFDNIGYANWRYFPIKKEAESERRSNPVMREYKRIARIGRHS